MRDPFRRAQEPPVTAVDQRAVVDLLGVLAYAELTAFDRLAEDARMAPTLDGRAALARMAAAEIGHFGRLTERLRELGAEPNEAMTPFVRALDAFHEGTRPSTWLEGLVKAYVGDGLAADFYREIAASLPDPDRELVLEVLADTGHADFAVREVRAAIRADQKIAGRLALWGRRLVGEAISQSQAVIAEHDQLAQLIVEGTGDLAGLGRLIERITAAHTARMKTLGLNP
jgi:rubrerythrin